MAKATRTRTAAGRTRRKAADKSFRPQVHIRMYCHGLGDCFLLRFETKKDAFFDVLVDCGIYKASPEAGDVMNRVVDDVIATTGNKLDLLVSTHEHWDHVSGFVQAIKKFEKMDIRAAWQAWTEDPDDPLATILRAKYETARARLVKLMRQARAALGARTVPGLEDAFDVMAFFGVSRDEEGGGGDPYQQIRDLMRSLHPRYLRPGMVEPVGETGVRAFVLGPPADEPALRRQDIAKRDAYEKQHLAFFDGLDALLGAAAAGLGEGDADEPDRGRPFDPGLGIPVAAAREAEFFQTTYGFDPDHPDAFRSIDDLAYDTLGSLALRMDKYINNTSLVLAFRLPNGKVLLFPGDAQGGNWKSWADPAGPLGFEFEAEERKTEKTDAHRLLAATVFYKVAHHGSHNATPRTYGLDLMTSPELRAFVPVDHAIARQARYGEMPLVAILDALKTKTRGAVFCSDGLVDGIPDTIRFAKKKLKVKIRPDDDPIERPLYCETSFDLE